MYKLINKMIGFKTKDLYIAELGKYKKVCIGVDGSYTSLTGNTYPNCVYNVKCNSFALPKYIICKKESDYEYIDIFTGSIYEKYNHGLYSDGDILIKNIEPIISNKSRIKYKDAEGILETKNTLVIKNRKA